MYKLIFVISFFVILIGLLVFIVYSLITGKYKCNVTNLSMNNYVAQDYPVLMQMITNIVEPYWFITIIPDDIMYLDHNLYWPTNHMYIHLSDIKKFIDDNKQFFNGKKIVNQSEFINVLNNFIKEKPIIWSR